MLEQHVISFSWLLLSMFPAWCVKWLVLSYPSVVSPYRPALQLNGFVRCAVSLVDPMMLALCGGKYLKCLCSDLCGVLLVYVQAHVHVCMM